MPKYDEYTCCYICKTTPGNYALWLSPSIDLIQLGPKDSAKFYIVKLCKFLRKTDKPPPPKGLLAVSCEFFPLITMLQSENFEQTMAADLIFFCKYINWSLRPRFTVKMILNFMNDNEVIRANLYAYIKSAAIYEWGLYVWIYHSHHNTAK